MIVFTACTAKSGTYYFGYNLGHHPECFVCVEPRKVHGNLFSLYLSRRSQSDLLDAEKLWKEESLVEINENAKRVPVYVESDFRFISYCELAMRDLEDFDIRIIELKREKAKIARQLARNGYYKGNYFGWLLVPGLPNNIIPIDSTDPLTRSIWYTFEAEARIRRMKKQYPNIEFFEFDVDGVKLSQWEKLAIFLGIELTDRMIDIIKKDKVVNSWEYRSDVLKTPELELDNVRKKVEEFERSLR